MDLPPAVDTYIKESIAHSLGLPVSGETIALKLLGAEEARKRLQQQNFQLQDRLREKDARIQRTMAEAALNAQALKRQIEENENLKAECGDLLRQRKKLEQECSLYHHDRELLMEFGNEADERARVAENRVLEAEENSKAVSLELEYYKHEWEMFKERERREREELHTLRQRINEIEHSRLNGSDTNSPCSSPKKKTEGLQPASVHVPHRSDQARRSEVESLQKDKEQLRINLHRAEEEVKLLFEENERLRRLYNKERQLHASGGKHTGSISSTKGKRKSSPRVTNSVERVIDFSEQGSSPRRPLSPLQQNSPDAKMHKR